MIKKYSSLALSSLALALLISCSLHAMEKRDEGCAIEFVKSKKRKTTRLQEYTERAKKLLASEFPYPHLIDYSTPGHIRCNFQNLAAYNGYFLYPLINHIGALYLAQNAVSLNLSGNKLTKIDHALLTFLSKCKHPHVLDISNNQIKSLSGQFLDKARNCIGYADVRDNPFTKATLARLRKLPHDGKVIYKKQPAITPFQELTFEDFESIDFLYADETEELPMEFECEEIE